MRNELFKPIKQNESEDDYRKRQSLYKPMFAKAEQGIASYTSHNAQSGVAKEFDIQEKNNGITDIVSKALSVANIAIEISKNLSNFKGYKKKTPRKLVSIYNKVKKNDSRSFHCVNFAVKQAMLFNQLMIIKSQPIAPRNFTKCGYTIAEINK